MRRVALFAVVAALFAPVGAHAADCPATNAPDTLVLAGGTPQWSKVGQAFGGAFQVSLANSNGCPVTTGLVGVPVTFTAPASGASGTFASSGTASAVVGTGSNGSAASPQFTANTTSGDYVVVASSQYGSVSFALHNTASGVPASIRATTAHESATVGKRYAHPLRAVVLDATGAPVAGAQVSFALGSGASFDGGGAQATAVTDASGTAVSPAFTAGATAGTFTAAATVAGLGTTFALDDLAAGEPTITALGSPQTAKVGTRYSAALRVRVRDASGKPLQGVSVAFSLGGATDAGATFAGGTGQATAVTDADGIATSPRFSANTVAGSFTASATANGTSAAARFVLHNRAGAPSAISAGAAATESTPVGTPFPLRLAVTVDDADGNPVPGVLVTFTAPAHGASGTFAHARSAHEHTDAKGIAVAPRFTANRTQGGYVVTATVAGLDHAAAFALSNEAAAL